MHEIMSATYELIDWLEDSDIVSNIVFYKEKVRSNPSLCELIVEGKKCEDPYLFMDIKRKLYQDDDYKKYVDSCQELFIMVMDINRRYQMLLRSGNCHRNVDSFVER